MHLNRFTDYSIRTLFLVAANPDRLVRLSDIADYYDISIDHLRKVVHNLAKLGYLETLRGKHGGMRLAMPAESINIGRLIAQTEGGGPLIDCGSDCSLTPLCSLKGALHEAQKAFFDSLSHHTVATLLQRSTLVKALKLPLD